MARQRNRSDPVSPMNDSVWVSPRPDQEPSCFQSTTSFRSGSERAHPPNSMADAAANTSASPAVVLILNPPDTSRLSGRGPKGEAPASTPQEAIAFEAARSYVVPCLALNPVRL